VIGTEQGRVIIGNDRGKHLQGRAAMGGDTGNWPSAAQTILLGIEASGCQLVERLGQSGTKSRVPKRHKDIMCRTPAVNRHRRRRIRIFHFFFSLSPGHLLPPASKRLGLGLAGAFTGTEGYRARVI
jgi:hypothetical protein